MTTASKLIAADAERLNTWLPEIARALRPDVPTAHTAKEFRFGASSALAISRDGGGWFDHAAGKGDIWGLSLIRHLKKCTDAEAADWARAFLDKHPGEGSASESFSEDAVGQLQRERYADYVRKTLTDSQRIEG